ncbi:MAG: ATPase [Steroidobacteraceae bacterium]|nr:ATPase [Steroidobacteraceae bacterium]
MKRYGLCLLALLLCAAAGSRASERALTEFRHKGWTVEDGAPGDVSALAQSSDGMLWIGSSVGLFRFDGVRFVRYNGPPGDEFVSNNISALWAPPEGGLWVGFRFGGLAFLNEGVLRRYTVRDGLPDGTINALARDLDGTLWVAASAGLARLHGGRWEIVGKEWNYPGGWSYALLVDRAGTLWVHTGERVVYLPRGTRKFQETFEPIEPGPPVVLPLAEAPDGQIWIAHPSHGVRLLDGIREPRTRPNPWLLGPDAGGPLLFDRDGNLWVGGNGIRRIANPTALAQARRDDAAIAEHFTGAHGLTANYVITLFEDREGNIWAGTNAGLNRFTRSRLVGIGLPHESVLFTLAAGNDGAVWVASWLSNSNPLYRIVEGRVVETIDAPPITCAYRDRDGMLWFAGPQGLYRLEGNRLVKSPLPPSAAGVDVQAMVRDRRGALWLSAVRRGVFRYADGVWTAFGADTVLPREPAVTMIEDANGRLLFGYTDNRLAVIDGERTRLFSAADGLRVGNVTALHARGPHVWVGGERGLARFDRGRFQPVTATQPNAFDGVSGVIETSAGELWVSGSSGIARIPREELDRWLKEPARSVSPELLNYHDGLPGVIQQLRPLPSAIESADGRLWFAATNGVVWVDPAHIRRNPLPPPVAIWSVTAGGRTYAPVGRELRLPVGTSQMEIGYTAASFTVPERVRFRYRLEGLDKDWQDVGDRREAFYTNLPPGQYRFRVIAANNDGVWNTTGASFAVVIPPAFHQTLWFYALCAVLTFVVLLLLYQFRMRQVSMAVRGRLEERIVERERIARELHDTLLQGFQGLILRFQAVAERIPPREPAREMMERALERADQVMVEGRDRVKELRSTSDTLHDLPQAFANVGEQFALDQGCEFRVAVEGTQRELHPILREEIFLIGREAIINAFHHARAGKIEVDVAYGRTELRVSVRDDGCGIDAAVLRAGGRPGHWGLAGMRERAKKISAHLEIWSRAGAGTEVQLRVPGSLAYRSAITSGRWSWLRRGLRARSDAEPVEASAEQREVLVESRHSQQEDA